MVWTKWTGSKQLSNGYKGISCLARNHTTLMGSLIPPTQSVAKKPTNETNYPLLLLNYLFVTLLKEIIFLLNWIFFTDLERIILRSNCLSIVSFLFLKKINEIKQNLTHLQKKIYILYLLVVVPYVYCNIYSNAFALIQVKSFFLKSSEKMSNYLWRISTFLRRCRRLNCCWSSSRLDLKKSLETSQLCLLLSTLPSLSTTTSKFLSSHRQTRRNCLSTLRYH